MKDIDCEESKTVFTIGMMNQTISDSKISFGVRDNEILVITKEGNIFVQGKQISNLGDRSNSIYTALKLWTDLCTAQVKEIQCPKKI